MGVAMAGVTVLPDLHSMSVSAPPDIGGTGWVRMLFPGSASRPFA
jgi:hypothetical protein